MGKAGFASEDPVDDSSALAVDSDVAKTVRPVVHVVQRNSEMPERAEPEGSGNRPKQTKTHWARCLLIITCTPYTPISHIS